jgi:hypothetical protein
MEDDEESECLILSLQILSECLTMIDDISYTHDEDDHIHQKCPEPDRTRMYPHPVKCHGESIEHDRDQEHPSSGISVEGSYRFEWMDVRLLYSKHICPSKGEHDTKESIDIHPFSEEEDTGEDHSDRNESLER